MHDLGDIQEVQGLSLNETIAQARLSRPASLDGGFAYTETHSTTNSMDDVCFSSAGTYITAAEQTSLPKSQMPLPFNVPTTIAAVPNHFDSNLDGQTEAQAQNSVQLEHSNANTITSDNHKILAQGTSTSTIYNEGTEASQSDRLVGGVASSVRKLVSGIQDEYPERPVSPATHQFEYPLSGKTELPRPLSTLLEESSGSVAMHPVPSAVKPLFKSFYSSGSSLADLTDSEDSDNLDSPYQGQNCISKTLEGQPGLGASSADDNQKQRRVFDWVEAIPNSSYSDSGSRNHDDLGIFQGRKVGGNETVSVDQHTSNEDGPSILGTSTRNANTDFEECWKKAESKLISLGPFSPDTGHFSPPSSVEVSPRPDRTASSQQNRKSPLLTTTIPSHLQKFPESSLTPALKHNLLHQVPASPPTVTPPATSGSAGSRALLARRPPTPQIPLASVSGSSISTELSPSELAVGPVHSLGASVSLDHLRPAPITKVSMQEDHLHPALRAHPFFNPADHLDDIIAPVEHRPTAQTITEPGPRGQIRFQNEEPPSLTRDFMESPMRGEFALAAKEMSTKEVLKKKLKGAKEGMKRLVGRGGGSPSAELNCFAK
ncbi:MAG: hypothetical protein Q9195_001922 [Heterodermia aff. obscurata]